MTDHVPNVEQPAEDSPDLATALQRIGLELPTETVERIDRYRQLLWEKNQVMNLTRHTTFDLFVRRDVVDSVELAEVLTEREDVLDLGTGGGVPGILLAILRPDLNVSLSESVQKKARAVEQFVERLELPVAVFPMPAQEILQDVRFSSVVNRAVGSLARQLRILQNCWDGFDRLLTIKGPKWIEERGEARHLGLLKGLDLRKVRTYRMPGTQSHSVILQITRPGSPFSPFVVGNSSR